MAFHIALSGLNAASEDLNVVGNNIANAGTTGFKQSRAEFADVFASSGGAVSSNAIGGGVRLAKVAQQFSQGNVTYTNNNMDLAINGQGFFVLKNNGSEVYTRAGAFGVDQNGYVVNSSGERLQVYAPANSAGTTFNTGSLTDLQVSTSQGAPNPTANVSSLINLDSSSSVPTTTPFSTTDPSTYNYSTSFTMYDSLGTSHTSTLYFKKTAANTWQVYGFAQTSSGTAQQLDLGGAGVTTGATLAFNSDGTVNTAASTSAGKPVGTFSPTDGATSPQNITFDFTGLTQYGSGNSVNAINQDGYSTGRLTGISIGNTGVVSAQFTNGQSRSLGQVALANFANPQGLSQLGNTSWAASYESGGAINGQAGSGSFGSIQSGALEASNVDLAAQLINLITAQRDFQANAQTITTANNITQTIIQMR